MRSESLDLCNEELLLVLGVSVQMSHQRIDERQVNMRDCSLRTVRLWEDQKMVMDDGNII